MFDEGPRPNRAYTRILRSDPSLDAISFDDDEGDDMEITIEERTSVEVVPESAEDNEVIIHHIISILKHSQLFLF